MRLLGFMIALLAALLAVVVTRPWFISAFLLGLHS